MVTANFKEIEKISKKTKLLFEKYFPDVGIDLTTQEIILWEDGDFQIRVQSAYLDEESNNTLADVIYYHSNKGYFKHKLAFENMEILEEEKII